MGTTVVTGASGLLGSKIHSSLLNSRHTFGWSFRSSHPDLIPVDIRSKDQVDSFFDDHVIDVCVHTAARVDVDECERNPLDAWEVNAKGTWNIAQACARHGSKLIYISTDYVFDGTKKSRYDETAQPAPLQVYGRTKFMGERFAATVRDHLILRLPLLYGRSDRTDRPTFPDRVLRDLRAGKHVKADDHQLRQPTLVDDVAGVLSALLAQGSSGIVHVASQTPTTKWEWATDIARTLGVNDDLVVRDNSLPDTSAARPPRSLLRVDRLRSYGIDPPRSTQEALVPYLREVGIPV